MDRSCSNTTTCTSNAEGGIHHHINIKRQRNNSRACSILCVLSASLIFLPEICASNDTTSRPTSATSTIRLVGSSKTYEGVVEVFLNGQWGAICDDNLLTESKGNAFAGVACWQLGYHSGRGNFTNRNQHSYFRRGVSKYGVSPYFNIFYDGLNCFANEKYLEDCRYSRERDTSCDSRNVAAVKCNDGTWTDKDDGTTAIDILKYLALVGIVIVMAIIYYFFNKRVRQRRIMQQRRRANINIRAANDAANNGTEIPSLTTTSNLPPGSYPSQPHVNLYPTPVAKYPPQAGVPYPPSGGGAYPAPQAGVQSPPPSGAPYPPPGYAPYPPPGDAVSNAPAQPPNSQTPAYHTEPSSNPAYPPPESYHPSNYAPDASAPPPPSYDSVT